ncbi:MAG: hypothetical protein AAF196_07080 [Planctomycetota bacterium]
MSSMQNLVCPSVGSPARPQKAFSPVWALATTALILSLGAGLGAQESVVVEAEEPELQVEDVDSIETLQKFIRQRESKITSLRLSLHTEISPEPDVRMTMDSEVRVLSGTHLHMTARTVFPGDIEVETESVQRPGGNYFREDDPLQGEVFTSMTPEFRQRVEEATAVLANEGIPAPQISPEADALLGAQMLEDMNRSFEFTIDGPRVVGGERVWIVGGPLRLAGESEDLLGTGADRASLIVRTRDGLVQQVTQFREGRSVFDAKVVEFFANPELDPESFRIDLPAGQEWIDVMDHPPAQQQFEELFQLAEELKKEQPPAPEGGDGGR